MTLQILAAGGTDVERRLVIVLLQVGIIILVARVFAGLARRLGQPAVVGEIVAGLMLGPSVLGKLEPKQFVQATGQWVPMISSRLFDPGVGPIMHLLAQVGLVLLLFMIGLEFDFTHLRAKGKAAVAISATGVVAPFLLGIGLGMWMHPHMAPNVNREAFVLFLGTAMSITALPILGRMMMEMGISRTRTAALTITAAAIDDATGWILLAAVSAIATAHFNPMASLLMIGYTIAFGLGMLLVVRPIMRRWVHWIMARNRGELGANGFAVLLAVLFGCAIITSKIGIFAIFGAFMLGAVLSDQHDFRKAVHHLLGSFVTVFFLPIFFTYTGLRTDIGSLDSTVAWLFAGGVMAVAIGGKLGGCTLAARLAGLPPRESFCIGIMMNTRALMELVVVNVGYDLGVIPKNVFCMLVMMAVLTTIMTTPMLMRAMRGTELEPLIYASGFVRRRRPVEEVVEV